MTNRKTGLPMPLFLLSLPKTEDNKNIYYISELCNMKIKVERLNKKTGPAQCFRCQGFLHSSRFCTRNSKCVKCGKPYLTGLQENSCRRIYMLPLPRESPCEFLGMPKESP
ncbi:nucleic-acid-binding protein from transposon X-element [Trichonephila inaurata madagascariensis]|uniref:Nucleic-acid-binding protein from transposon X-element n=1 Tax=Trichonephila inaurata madagascariensis TaxID=2747483 RepID=A0A8X6WNY1_9ARAC|nr:nucleic-acid-binding protein from transposon X-element [Trichonephila inaurata madagascariensis]